MMLDVKVGDTVSCLYVEAGEDKITKEIASVTAILSVVIQNAAKTTWYPFWIPKWYGSCGCSRQLNIDIVQIWSNAKVEQAMKASSITGCIWVGTGSICELFRCKHNRLKYTHIVCSIDIQLLHACAREGVDQCRTSDTTDVHNPNNEKFLAIDRRNGFVT